MLTRQLVQNQLLVIPNSVQSNNISINLITSVDFLGIICPKSCVVSKRCHFPFFCYGTKNWHVLWNICLFIFFILDFLIFLLRQNESMSALDQLGEMASKREAELKRKREKKEAEERKL